MRSLVFALALWPALASAQTLDPDAILAMPRIDQKAIETKPQAAGRLAQDPDASRCVNVRTVEPGAGLNTTTKPTLASPIRTDCGYRFNDPRSPLAKVFTPENTILDRQIKAAKKPST